MRFWRVTDASSANPYHRGEGFIARKKRSSLTLDPQTWDEEKLTRHIKHHLDWYNTCPTPFISAYFNFETAEKEARSRMKRGKRNVTLWEICLDEDDDLEWETVNYLKKNLGFWIHDRAFHNAKHEALFKHNIPRGYIVGGTRFTGFKGRK
jgi:hypothetical protein